MLHTRSNCYRRNQPFIVVNKFFIHLFNCK